MRQYGEIWSEHPKFVFSRTLESVDFGCRLVHGDIGEVLAKLRDELDGEIDVSGPNIAVAVHRARPRGRVPPRRPPRGHRRGHAVLPSARDALNLRQVAVKRFGAGVLALTYVPT